MLNVGILKIQLLQLLSISARLLNFLLEILKESWTLIIQGTSMRILRFFCHLSSIEIAHTTAPLHHVQIEFDCCVGTLWRKSLGLIGLNVKIYSRNILHQPTWYFPPWSSHTRTSALSHKENGYIWNLAKFLRRSKIFHWFLDAHYEIRNTIKQCDSQEIHARMASPYCSDKIAIHNVEFHTAWYRTEFGNNVISKKVMLREKNKWFQDE